MGDPTAAWSAKKIRSWLRNKGIVPPRHVRSKTDLLKYVPSRYVDRAWLADRAYSTQYFGSNGPSYGYDPAGFSAWKARRQLLAGAEIRTPFMIPPESAAVYRRYAELWHDNEFDGNPFLEFLGDIGTWNDSKGMLIDQIAGVLSKNGAGFGQAAPEVLEWGLKQGQASFCSTTTVLVVPYKGTSVPRLTADENETRRNVRTVIGSAKAAYQEQSELLIENDNYGLNAATLAAELDACGQAWEAGTGGRYTFIQIQQIAFKGEASPGKDAKHANGAVIDLARRTAVYYEPHMRDANVYNDDGSLFIPYGDIQRCVSEYLGGLGYTMEPASTECPQQGDDSLCASWSIYNLVLRILNPDVPRDKLAHTASYADLCRMLYVAATAVPLSFTRRRRPITVDSMLEKADNFSPMDPMFPSEARTEVLSYYQEHPEAFARITV